MALSPQAANIEAGKDLAAAVCAACHGANGVSVSDALPNLAAQRAAYIEAQSPNLAKTGVTFPEGYKESFTKYHTINVPATKQVRYYYANKAAVAAAKAGKPLPDGSVLFVEVYAAKLDGDKPVTGGDGFFVADKLLLYTAMARDAGWGKDIPEMLRNDDNWNYAIFTADKQHRPDVNQAECSLVTNPSTMSATLSP
jgi:cytochrome c553